MSEFFSLAHALARDAETHYADAARHLRAQRNAPLADVFDALAADEHAHKRKVDRWAARAGFETHAPLPWPLPTTFDVSPKEAVQSKLMTTYQAFASAVRHGQHVFKFWSYVAAHADDPEVQAAAERMAREQLERSSLLRRQRRKAFFADRRATPAGKREGTLAELSLLERRLSALITKDSNPFGESRAIALAAAAKDCAAKLDALAARRPTLSTIAVSLPSGHDDDVRVLSEYLAEAYLQLAAAARDATMLATFQDLARHAVARLAALSSGGKNEAHHK